MPSTSFCYHSNITYHSVEVGLLLGAAGRLEASSLDLGAGHLLAQKRFSTQKEFVVVTTGITTPGQTAKAVKIQLALKRC
jgi:hypothetical protein